MAPTFTPPGSRSTPAILALYVKVGACALAVGADVRRIVVAGDLRDGRAFVDALLAADQLVTFAALVELVALVVAAFLFLRWQVVAHANLPALGDAAPRDSVTAGVVAWFVPVLNLFRPLRVIGDLWRAGDRAAPLPGLLRAWWALWVIALLAVLAAWTLPGGAADVGERQRIDALRAAASVLSAIAAALAIAVVVRVSARQEERAATTGAPHAGPSPGDGGGEERVSAGGLAVVREDELGPPGRAR